MAKDKKPKTSAGQDIGNDELVCAVAEEVRNGEPVDWKYWTDRLKITPMEAAKLGHCIDPLKWPDGKHAQGAFNDALRYEIERKSEWLAERNPYWTLAALVAVLGDTAPHAMKQAVWPAAKVEGKRQGATKQEAIAATPASSTESTKVGTGDTGISETIMTHKLENRRTHALTAVITTAKKSAVDATDYQSVWAALVELAELPSRPAPILGYAEIEGIKYRADKAANGVAFFNKDALRKMMGRAVAKTYPTTPTSGR